MAAPPVTVDAFYELVRRSQVVPPKRLDDYITLRRPAECGIVDARTAAQAAVLDGLMTRYQAEELLGGRWRNFVLAGKYLILERLGHGGSSAIFLANHLGIQRPVALKVLPTNQAENPEVLARFYREARAAAMLDHPNIADIYDLHRTEQMHFLVMEFVYGPDLEELVHRVGPLPPTRAASYISQAAAGLQHAHQAGLVHRDIKPGNLLVDRDGTVKILDLGLVRIFQSDDGLTRGQNFRYVLGTLDYQAPEQAVDSHDVDIRADIYSLGAMFYFLLTGQAVFPEGTIAEKLSWHQRRTPRPLGEIRPDVPAGLAAIAERMLAKSPSDRYQEPAEIVAALAEWAAEPVPLPTAAELPRLSKAARVLLDARPKPAARAFDGAAWRPPSPGPAPAVAAPPAVIPRPALGMVHVVAVSSQPPAERPAAQRRFPRRTALIAAAVAALAVAGARINSFVAGSPDQPPNAGSGSASPRMEPAGPRTLFDSIAGLNAKIVAESHPTARAALLVQRGNFNGRLGRWRPAADDFRRALELDPSGDWTWYSAIPPLAEIGDKAGYRNQCLAMHRIFAAAPDTILCERIAKLWCLTPECPGDPAIPTRLIDRAMADPSNKALYFWVMSTKGITEYRAGRFAESASWLAKAIEATPAIAPQCKIISNLFLAMALRRQAQDDQARRAFSQAGEMLDRHLTQDGGDLGTDWFDWLMCSIVRREAEQVLGLGK